MNDQQNIRKDNITWILYLITMEPFRQRIGGFHAISGDTNNNGEMNECWWTNKAS